MIIVLGLFAFACGTAGGVLFGKVMYKVTGGKVNPLIGSAGVSAVPMAARVSQKVGQAENPGNFLLMHAMGPNVAGVIGSAVAAGVLLAICLIRFPTFLDLTDASIIIYPDACPRPGKLLYAVCRTSRFILEYTVYTALSQNVCLAWRRANRRKPGQFLSHGAEILIKHSMSVLGLIKLRRVVSFYGISSKNLRAGPADSLR
mgnify:CR=1 FL=1